MPFSFASVVLSYFLVGGGLFTGTLLVGLLKINSEYALYAAMAAGGFLGGFVAARASRGETILEPAIGAAAVVATIVAVAASTPLGKMIWAVSTGGTMKFVGIVGATCIGGAIGGAFISEKLFGESTSSSAPWIIYSGLATMGACLLITMLIGLVVMGRAMEGSGTTDKGLATAMLAGIGGGALLAGISVGASARSNPMLASFLGGALGVGGFALLVTRSSGGSDKNTTVGIVIFAIGGAVVTFVGAAIGWSAIGKKQAG